MTKSGDHENYYVELNISHLTDHLINKNCLFVNTDCTAIAVKIRTKGTHFMWPTNKKNILMFSSKVSPKFTDGTEEYHWHKGVKPHYG